MRKDLASLLRDRPDLLSVLHDYGIHVCAGCLLTLTAPADRAAAYHGVPDVPAFLRALERPARRSRRKHPRRPASRRK